MLTPIFFLAAGAVAAIAYLLGSLNCAIIVSRLHAKDDVRSYGSGNAGMTNMLRTYGKGPAILTAAGDFAKSVAAVLLGRLIFRLTGLDQSVPLDAGYIAGLFALVGHLFPLYFGFKGGKGVITTLGVIFLTDPVVFLIIAAVFIPLVFITRIVSICSILGAAAYPLLTWGFHILQSREPLYDTIFAAVVAAIVIFMHRANIVRLLNGTENRFGGKKK
jgi:glycerol-3-phosphate acyltransferase PlsY